MQYLSTRDSALRVSAQEAIVRGLAPQSGLFVPETFPKADLEGWKDLSYPVLAEKVLAGFLTEYSADFLHTATAATYGEAFGGKAGETVKVRDGLYSLELWHGPTCAFKDYALQLMPKLLVEAKKMLGRTEAPMVVLSTASPFKFPRDVLTALGETAPASDFAAMAALTAKTGAEAPASLSELDKLEVRFKTVLQPADIRTASLR